MMLKPFIKICGISNVVLAKLASEAGAHFIGLVFHPHSTRYLKIEEAKKISKAIQSYGAIPVGVFVNHHAQEILQICLHTHIQVVQLHGSTSRKEHYLLPDDFARIYIRPVTAQGEIQKDHEEGLQYCDPSRDYILFDRLQAGKGKKFNWHQFQYTGSFRWFLAGGLTAANVGDAIKQLHPTGIDVSSGVENELGEKDARLIQQFIHTIRNNGYVDHEHQS